jgi:hypothetical protein
MTFNINTATIDQLTDVKGLGPVMAARILQFREDFGFNELMDIMQVPGVNGAVYGEMKKMGVACEGESTQMTEEEIKMEREKADIVAFVRHMSMVMILGSTFKGREWASKQKNTLVGLWIMHGGKKDIIPGVVETAREMYANWENDNKVSIYHVIRGHSCIVTDDDTLCKEASRQADKTNWGSTMVNTPLRPIEETIYSEMVESVYQGEEEYEKAGLIEKAKDYYNNTRDPDVWGEGMAALLTMLDHMERPLSIKQKMEGIRRSTARAEHLWTRAWYEAQGIMLDNAAEEQSEGVAKIDNQEDLDDTMKGDTPDLLPLEWVEGQTEGFIPEPNWMHIYHMKEVGEQVFEKWMAVMVFFQKVYSQVNGSRRKEAAELFKSWNKNLWDLHTDKDKARTNLMMMGNGLGMIKKGDLQLLSQKCVESVRVLFPNWRHLPTAILSYEDHMKKQGKAAEAKRAMTLRDRTDSANIATHLKQKNMNLVDFGHLDEDGNWGATEVATPDDSWL